MLLLPLWPQETSRPPVITLLLILANLVGFMVASPALHSQNSTITRGDLNNATQKLVAILSDPEAHLSEVDRNILYTQTMGSEPSPQLIELLTKVQDDRSSLNDKLRYQWDLIYPLFDSYLRAAPHLETDTSLFNQFGFNPQRPWWPAIITHQFIHENWWHFLLNMLFLWIIASIAEERLGLNLIWVYLSGGVAGALAQTEFGIPAGQLLVGASGALSAIMGFSLVARSTAKIRLFYLAFLPLPKAGTFDSPLWFFLPIWLGTQIVMALVITDKSTLNTAYVDHIGGFLFGVLIGFVWSK